MRCYACNSSIEVGDKFCAACGAPARQNICAACGWSNQLDNTFCVQCGQELDPLLSARMAARSSQEIAEDIGQLKYVSLLRADLVESTALVAGLDPDQAVTRLEPALTVMRIAVRHYRGLITKEIGDGLLAVFGAPIADDNHAFMACHAAMDLVRRITAIGDANFRVRVGLHSGFVVARRATEPTAVHDFGGPAFNLVERLQAVAAPNQIYTSEACQRLCEGHITFERMRPKLLKGFTNPVPLYRAVGLSERSRWRVRLARTSCPFFGRNGEIAALMQAAAEVSTNSGQIISLVGDPGVGKSRLGHEFVQQLRDTGWRVIEVECSPTLQASPFAALKGLVTSLLGPHSREDDDRRVTREDPRTELPRLWRTALDSLLEQPISDPDWHELQPRLRGRAIADACRAILENVVNRNRTVLLIEDLHWIDSASDAAIASLRSLSTRHQLLLFVTSRPTLAPEWLATRNVTRVWLRPLDDASAMAMLDALVGSSPRAPDLKARILRHTGGVPLFIEEVCRRLVGTGILRGKWGALTPAKPIEELGVPPTIQGVIAARIDQLDKFERDLLRIASAIGPRSSIALLRAVAAVPETSLRKRLAELHAAELLVEASLLPEQIYEFPHDLMRQVTYDSMLESTREQLHKRILLALELASPKQLDDQADILCYHALRAKDWRKTAAYARAVGKKCLTRSALSDASRYFRTAIEAIDRLPKSQQREETAIDVRIESRLAFSGFGQVDRWLELAKDAEERAGAIGDTARKIAAMAVRAGALNFYGAPLEAISVGESVLHHAEELDHGGWLAFAEYGLGQAYFIAGRCRQAEQLLGRACARLSSPDAKAPPGTTLQSAWLLSCVMKTAAHVTMGELESADPFRRRACSIAAESQRPVDLVAAGYSNGLFLLCRGDMAGAHAGFAEALDLAQQNEIRLFVPLISCHLGIASLEQGDVDQARKILTDARVEAEAIGYSSVFLRASNHLALTLCRGGETEAALKMVRAARAVARQQGFLGLEAEAQFTEAEILAATSGNPIAIATCLRGSLAIASQIEARPQVVKIKALLGRVLARAGEVDAAARETQEAADLLSAIRKVNEAKLAFDGSNVSLNRFAADGGEHERAR